MPAGTPPTALLLNGTIAGGTPGPDIVVAADIAAGGRLARLGAIDPDAGDSFTFDLIDDAGGRFFIQGGNLRRSEGSILDAAGDGSYTIRVRATDSAGGVFEQDVVIGIADAGIAVRQEGTAGGETQASAGGREFFVASGGNDRYELDNADIVVYSGRREDYDIAVDVIGGGGYGGYGGYGGGSPVTQVTVRDLRPGGPDGEDLVLDPGGFVFADGSYSISDVQTFAPTGLTLDGRRLDIDALIDEEVAIGTIVGQLGIRDLTPGESLTVTALEVLAFPNTPEFTFPDVRNDLFSIGSDNRLTVSGRLNFEQYSQFGLRVFFEDSSGNAGFDVLSIHLDDVNDPPRGIAFTPAIPALPEWPAPTAPVTVGGLSVEAFDEDGAPEGYEISLSGRHADLFEVVGDELRLKAGSVVSRALGDELKVTVTYRDPTLPAETAVSRDIVVPVEPGALSGSEDADTLTGGRAGDVIVAGGGDDTVSGLAGDDKLYGGSGADTISASRGNDTVFGDGLLRLDPAARGLAATVIDFATGTTFNPSYSVSVEGIGPVAVATGSMFAGQGDRRTTETAHYTIDDVTPTGGLYPLLDFGTGADSSQFFGSARLIPSEEPGNRVLFGGFFLDGGLEAEGPLAVRFSTPVAGFGLDLIGADVVGAVKIVAYDRQGLPIGEAANTVTGLKGYTGLATATGEPLIAGFSVFAIGPGGDPEGFAIDTLTLYSAAEITALVASGLLGGAVDQGDSVTGGDGDDLLFGELGSDLLRGGAGADTLVGGIGADRLFGEAGDDIYLVDEAGDIVHEGAGDGNDTVLAEASYRLRSGVEVEVLAASASAGGLELSGNDFDNVVTGGAGDDVLKGRDGGDRLTGGGGRDLLVGDAGADVFIVSAASDSAPVSGSDRIRDFEQGFDRIDLSAILSSGGTPLFLQAIAGAAFTGQAGELRVDLSSTGNVTVLSGDLDGDRSADLQIRILGNVALVASDLIL